MRTYLSFFKTNFINSVQYRLAAYSGIFVQFCWAIMNILLYKAFYSNLDNVKPMEFEQLVAYLWLQQAFFMLFETWFLDGSILSAISEGNISYELCRPIELYNMWFSKNVANRVAKACLRCVPIILVASLLPKPYKLIWSNNWCVMLGFFISLMLSLFLVTAFTMIIYITTFYTVSPMGVRMVFSALIEFLAGGVVPLPLFPEAVQKIINILPFAYMQNAPFMIFSEKVKGAGILITIFLQLIWLLVLVFVGKSMLSKATKRVIVQGG